MLVFILGLKVAPSECLTIEPLHIESTLEAGESDTFALNISTEETSISKIDVAFVFDVTGSMYWVEDTAKEKAEMIKDSILEMVADTAFGVAWFADYPGDYSYPDYSDTYGDGLDSPWALIQDITTESHLVDSAINDLPYMEGGDWPESYTRALYETEFLDWRDGAKKIVIIFGDAPLHDLDFYSSEKLHEVFGTASFGGDPGRDGVAMTGDDLNFETVVGELNEAGIVVMGIYCTPDFDQAFIDIAKESFNYMTAETGGQLIEIDSAEEIPLAIASLIESEVKKIDYLTLEPPLEYSNYVSWTPLFHEDIGPETTITFDVTISIPPDVRDLDALNFAIDVVGDGSVLATTDVSIFVPGLKQSRITCYTYQDQYGRGEIITVTGSIEPAIEGELIELTYVKPGGSTIIRTVTTDRSGSFIDEFLLEQTGLWSVESFWDGGGEYGEATSIPIDFTVEESGGYDERSELARLAAITFFSILGGFGANILAYSIDKASGGGGRSIEVGDVIEGTETRTTVRITVMRQILALFFSIILVGVMYSLVTSSTRSTLFFLEIPFKMPLLGDVFPIEYISDIDFYLFTDVVYAIIFCSGTVFIWRYILQVITSKIQGVKVAIRANKTGILTLIATSFLTIPFGFPLTSIYEYNATLKEKGHIAFVKNIGLLMLILPFYLILKFNWFGWYSQLVGGIGTLITLMTFFYSVVPINGEGKDIFRWNKIIDLILMIIGLVLFFGFQLSKLNDEVYLSLSVIAVFATAFIIYTARKNNRSIIKKNQGSPS